MKKTIHDVTPGMTEGETMLSTNRGRYRFNVGHVPVGEESRKEFGGPMVPGPWAYTYGLCSVIDNHGGTGAEIAKAKDEGRGLEVKDGDLLRVAGHVYTVRYSDWHRRGENLKLDAVKEEETKCRKEKATNGAWSITSGTTKGCNIKSSSRPRSRL